MFRRKDPRKFAPGDRIMRRDDPGITGTVTSHGESNPSADGGDWVYQVDWDVPPPQPLWGEHQIEAVPPSRASCTGCGTPAGMSDASGASEASGTASTDVNDSALADAIWGHLPGLVGCEDEQEEIALVRDALAAARLGATSRAEANR